MGVSSKLLMLTFSSPAHNRLLPYHLYIHYYDDNLFRFVPDLDDIVCFEELMTEEKGASCMPEETVAAARYVCVGRGEGVREWVGGCMCMHSNIEYL